MEEMPAGYGKLQLEPKQGKYLLECLAQGRNWFVTRKGIHGRKIQASSATREGAEKTFHGWQGQSPSLIQILDGKVIWHKAEGKRSDRPVKPISLAEYPKGGE